MDTFGLNKRMEGDVLTVSDIIKRTGEKEAVIKLLQMQTYLIVSNFLQRRNKRGKPYGWRISFYTPQKQSEDTIL